MLLPTTHLSGIADYAKIVADLAMIWFALVALAAFLLAWRLR